MVQGKSTLLSYIFTNYNEKLGRIIEQNFVSNDTFVLQTYFDAPEGNGPVVIQMNKMSKGMVWVNGRSIGRYWVSFLSPLAQPTQSE